MIEAEGKVYKWESPENIRADFLETFDFDSPQQYIKTETREFIAACPFSGLPDVGRLIIEYYPEGGRCIELKSLKYYVVSFKNVGLFQEGVTRRIFDDLKAGSSGKGSFLAPWSVGPAGSRETENDPMIKGMSLALFSHFPACVRMRFGSSLIF